MNLTNIQIGLLVVLGILVALIFFNYFQINQIMDCDDGRVERMSSCGANPNASSGNSRDSGIQNQNLFSGNEANPKLVLYYTAWCGHSRTFISGGWKDFIEHVKSTPDLKAKLNVEMISCETDEQKCAAQGINGYPTIALFVGGKKIPYSGYRTKEALVDFVKPHC